MRGIGVFPAAVAVAFLSVANAAFAAEEEVVKVATRPGVEQAFFFAAPAKPSAAAILFPGGDGRVDLGKIAAGKFLDRGNFLVRARNFFVADGVAVAIVGVASDLSSGHTAVSRFGADHARDIDGVVAYLKTRARVPVWLVGTSAGTESAASVGIALGGKIAGVVLTSSVTGNSKMHTSVLSLGLEKIAAPVLVVAHRNDACFITPPSGAERIASASTASPRKRVLYFEGGDPPRSNPCQALSPHGFIGIEKEVVAAIAAFIKER